MLASAAPQTCVWSKTVSSAAESPCKPVSLPCTAARAQNRKHRTIGNCWVIMLIITKLTLKLGAFSKSLPGNCVRVDTCALFFGVADSVTAACGMQCLCIWKHNSIADAYLKMNRMQQMLAQMGLGQGPAVDPDAALPDTAEKVQISSLSLLKMLKHGNLNPHFQCLLIISKLNWVAKFSYPDWTCALYCQVAPAFLWRSWVSCWAHSSMITQSLASMFLLCLR